MTTKRNKEVIDIWNTNAAFWDKRMGEGNDFHRLLLEPNLLDMLQIKKGDAILEVGCGNGQLARKMAGLGAKVTAIDGAAKFIKIAKQKPLADKIDYRVIDITNTAELKKLKDNTYDAIVCNMVLMDVENIEPFIGFLPQVLKKNGRFIFSVTHPCFNSGETALVHERNDIGGEIHEYYGVKVSNYLKARAAKGLGMIGQPLPQYYFHRPLSELLKVCFKNGFFMDDLREPSFKESEVRSIYNNVFVNIPPAIICGFKLIK